MANQLLSGFLYTDAGVAIVGATVNLYARNTTTPVLATTTTDANGYWSISHATEGRFDVEIVNGSSIRRRKYDTREQIDTMEVANFRIRNPADTFDYDIVPAAIVADRQLNLPLLTGTDEVVVKDLAQTLTNKRVSPRVGTVASAATPTINTDDVDVFIITAQAVDITSMTTNLSGTPTNGQLLLISITGTAARAITWGASFENGLFPLPSTTVTTQRLDVHLVWNATTSKWRHFSSQEGDHPRETKLNGVRWVMPGWYVAAATTYTVIAGVIYYMPIFVSERTTYIRIGIIVDTLSAGEADLRIFNWGNGLPTSLVLSAGVVDTGTTGAKEITISQELTRGYYFLAVRCTGTPALRCPDSVYPVAPPTPGFRVLANLPVGISLLATATYTDPAPAPTANGGVERCLLQLREN